MAIGIDTSKWKPRKIKGTPAARVRNILAVSVITIGLLSGALFHFSKITVGIRTASENLYEEEIKEIERRRLIGAGLPVSSAQLRERLEEAKDMQRYEDFGI